MSDLADLKMAELRERAAEAGITVPVGTSKAALVELLSAPVAPEGERGSNEHTGHPSIAEGIERRPIEYTSQRGDWLDPFSGKTIYYGDQVSPASGARREGDEAVLSVKEVERLASR